MILPEELISKLLLRHSCVIVPGFGGFVAQRVSAKVDAEKGIMYPPKKALLFNRQLINNDGLLTSELALEAEITFNEASTLIQSMVNNWQRELSRGARVTIDKVGFLFYDKEKNLCFEQDRFFNLLLESFGLGKVHFALAEPKEEARVLQLTPPDSDNSQANNLTQLPKRATWKYLAAACLLPLAFYSFWIPAKTNVLESGLFSVRDFNPFHKIKPTAYSKEKLVPVIFDKTAESKFKEQKTYEFLPGILFPMEQLAKRETNTDALATTTSGKRALNQCIVGCFKSQENADLMISKLKLSGLDAYVFDTSNGLQRVSAGGSDTEMDLMKIKDKVASLGFSGWILRTNNAN
jgi:hypothetical protein